MKVALHSTLSFLETEKEVMTEEEQKKRQEDQKTMRRQQMKRKGKDCESETVEKEETGQGSAPSDIWLSPS